MRDLPGCKDLRGGGGEGGARDTHLSPEDEHRVEHHIQQIRAQGNLEWSDSIEHLEMNGPAKHREEEKHMGCDKWEVVTNRSVTNGKSDSWEV